MPVIKPSHSEERSDEESRQDPSLPKADQDDVVSPIIEVQDLSFAYGGERILDNISFSISQGEYVGIIGPNGGGKTTLLKAILGLIPFSGTIKLFGTPVSEFKQWWRIGYLPQRSAQIDPGFPISSGEVVRQGRIARVGMFKSFSKTDEQAIQKAMETTGIEHLKDRRLNDLSGGERQRVFIARALAGEPDILILDEPSVGVDVHAQEKFYEFLHKIHKTLGLTILFISHDIDVLLHEASDILCLNRGLIQHAKPREITDDDLKTLFGRQIKYILHDH